MTAFKPLYRPVRRIVTGEDEQGRSFIASDGPTPNVVIPPGLPTIAQVPWATGRGVARGEDPAPADHVFGFHSEGGSLLRIVDFAPDENYDEDKIIAFLDEVGVRDTGKP